MAAAAEEAATVEEAAAVEEPSDVSHRTSAEDGVGSDRWPLNQSDWIGLQARARDGQTCSNLAASGRARPGPMCMCLAWRARACRQDSRLTCGAAGSRPSIELSRSAVSGAAVCPCLPLLAPPLALRFACPAAALRFACPAAANHVTYKYRVYFGGESRRSSRSRYTC